MSYPFSTSLCHSTDIKNSLAFTLVKWLINVYKYYNGFFMTYVIYTSQI